MAYTLTFVDRASRTYTLTITTVSGSGTIEGGGTTIETTEDADVDMFKPVRCQTGYFRFLTLHNDTNARTKWLNMIPTDSLSRPVKLERGSTTVWQGYIQPQVFENEYPGLGTIEHSLPIQCPLSVLDTLDIDPAPNEQNSILNNTPTMTFGQLLQTHIFGRLTGTSITDYYIQGSKAVTEGRLAVKIMWANFLTTDSSNHLASKYTCKQVLEEFCKFFGYTCRMHGRFIYFTQPTESTTVFTRFSSLAAVTSGVQVSQSSFTIDGSMIANTDNQEEVHPGVGNVTVRSDINMIDNLIEIPYDELYDQYNTGIPSGTLQDPLIIERPLDWQSESVYCLIRTPKVNGGTMTYDNDAVTMTCYAATLTNSELRANKYCRFFVYDSSDVGDIETQELPESKKSYGWQKCVELFHGILYNGGDTNVMFSITSKQTFVVNGGILYISFKTRGTSAWADVAHDPSTPHELIAQLRVGGWYWTGSSWSPDQSTFRMPLTSDGPASTRTRPTDPQYDGYGIPVTSTLQGIVEFKIIDVPWMLGLVIPTHLNGFLPMSDFEIGFVRGVVEDQKHRGNEYTSKGGAFRDEVNVDLIFASDVTYGTGDYARHMPAGLGYILDSTDAPMAKIPAMSGSPVNPEQELARVIAAYGNRTHRVVRVSVRESMISGDITPLKLSAGLENGMFPLAVSRNWRDDVTTITLISI